MKKDTIAYCVFAISMFILLSPIDPVWALWVCVFGLFLIVFYGLIKGELKGENTDPKHYSVDHSEDNWDMNKLTKRNTQCVDLDVRLDDYKILGQQLGFGICKATKLKWEHFDWVSLINESSHPIKKTKAYTFIGYRDERKAILLCEKIN